MDEVLACRSGDRGQEMTKKPTKKVSVGDLVGELGKRAPYDFAEEWDNVGFLAGDASDEIKGVVVAVNLGPEALKAAAERGANVIVCHHPPIFKPVSRLTKTSSPYLYEALRKGVSVIALHTNFDLACSEVAETITAHLGVKKTGFLAPRGGSTVPASLRLGKFITYLPSDALDKVREAVCRAGAGRIGNYTDCSFSWDGQGTYVGGDGSNPTSGKAGRLEKVEERRLEVVFPWKSLDSVIQAARGAHPYEEMAYDIIELKQPQRSVGYGFTAEDLSANLTFPKLLDSVKQTFQLSDVTVAGPAVFDQQMKIRRLAFSPGSGSSFVGAAAAKGIDVYICGEVGYHQMLEARQKGVTLMMLGHSYSERFFVEAVSSWCEPFGSTEKVFEMIHKSF